LKGNDIFQLIKALTKAEKSRVKRRLSGKADYLTDLFDKMNRQKEYDPRPFSKHGHALNSRFDNLRDEILDTVSQSRETSTHFAARIQTALDLSREDIAATFLPTFAQLCHQEQNLTGLLEAYWWKDRVNRAGFEVEFSDEVLDLESTFRIISNLKELRELYEMGKELFQVAPDQIGFVLSAQKGRLQVLELVEHPKVRFWKYKLYVLHATLKNDFLAGLEYQKKINQLFEDARISPKDRLKEIQQMALFTFKVGQYSETKQVFELIRRMPGVEDRLKEIALLEMKMSFSFNVGDFGESLSIAPIFIRHFEGFTARRKVIISYFLSLAALHSKNFIEAIRWGNEVFKIPHSSRKDFHWPVYLIQSLSYWNLGDVDHSDQLKLRAIRSAKNEGCELPVKFLQVYQQRRKSAKLLDELPKLLSNPKEKLANEYFNFEETLLSFLLKKDIQEVFLSKYMLRSKSYHESR